MEANVGEWEVGKFYVYGNFTLLIGLLYRPYTTVATKTRT